VALKLIVEVDGHHQTEEGRERDGRRDRYLAGPLTPNPWYVPKSKK
jgi:very-short-patch-repair endonuclease